MISGRGPRNPKIPCHQRNPNTKTELADEAMVIVADRSKYLAAYKKIISQKNPTITFTDFVLDLKVLESLGKGQVNKVIYGAAGADITHVC